MNEETEEGHESNEFEFDIAIVGYAGRFPGAADVESLWQNLANGIESISWFGDAELAEAGVPFEVINDPRFVKAAPILEGADLFDAKFFGYSPREARLMDPQQRLLLETAHAAMEHGGYDPESYGGRIGVFAGTAMNTYILNAGVASQFTTDYLPTLLGNDKDFLATRIAYKLGLNGPAMTIQTACSTSLVALHVASQSLLSRETDMALVGAMAVRVPQASGHLYEEGSVFTPDGHCRTFDAKASGTLFGSGGGVVLVKRLTDAISDGDTVHAVVRGTAVNNDGSSKSDFTAPSVTTQAEAITEALGAADVDAGTVSYIEAHGTGTYLGDPIEVEALTRAFRNDTDRTQYCGIGSVKPNIGHLDAAAGMAGLLKLVKAFEHRQLPPTINFEEPNPQIDFPSTPFRVIDQLTDWIPDGGAPLRAGLTSLGMGGTNAHVVLEEPPMEATASADVVEDEQRILVLSARTPEALDAATKNLAEHLSGPGQTQVMADIAHTLQVGRKYHNHRRSLVAGSHDEAVSILRGDIGGALSTTVMSAPLRPVFLFPGGGMQHPKMGKGLYESNDVYRATVDECAGYAQDHLGVDIRQIIFGAEDTDEAELDRTDMFMPAMFATCYANARMWMAMGVEPVAMAGHSLGEYVAATIAGVFSVADAVRLVIRRGQLGRSVSGGVMFAIAASADEVRPFLVPGAEISVVNGPSSCVVSGTLDAVAELEENLVATGIEGRRLRLQEAYHCSMLDPILDDFAKDVSDVTRNAPSIPVASNISGTWLTDQEATSVDYWVQHLRQPVRFDKVFAAVADLGDIALLEAGPNQSMVSMARQHPALKGVPAIPSARRFTDDTPDETMALRAIGKLWEAGVDIDFASLDAQSHRRVPLPTYPFESKRFWFEGPSNRGVVSEHVPAPPRSTDLSQWVWQVENRPKSAGPARAGLATVVVGANNSDAAKAILISLVSAGVEVQSIEPGSLAGRVGELSGPDRKLHVIDLTALGSGVPIPQMVSDHLQLIRLLGADDTVEIDLSTVVDSSAAAIEQAAAATGPALVAGKEYDHLRTRLVEVDPTESSWVEPLTQELLAKPTDAVVSISDQVRTIQTVTRVAPPESQLPAGGTYLITGGLGGIGLSLAEHLVSNRSARVALVSRRSLPPVEEWSQLPSSHPQSAVIDRLRQMNADDVAVFSADVSDHAAMADIFDDVVDRFGKIDGVFHSAGVINDALVALRDPDELPNDVLDPKVKGSRVLYEGLARTGGGFLALFSSMNALLAPPGQADYVAANNFMDRFAKQHEGPVQVVSIGWPGWRDVGIIATMEAGPVREKAMARGVDSTEGFALLERLVLSGIPHTIVSPIRFDNELSAAVASQLVARVQASTPSGASVAPSGLNPVESIVAGYFQDLLGVDDPSLEDGFFDLGGTSLVAVKLFNRVEADFDLTLTLDTMIESNTIRGLGAVLAEQRPEMLGGGSLSDKTPDKQVESSDRFKSLVKLRDGGDRPPLYMVHGHGGNVVGLLQLAERIDPERKIFGLQSIGLSGGSQIDLSIEDMAARYLSEIRAARPNGPYMLSGYCMGGVIAFEMAQQLVAAGEEPPTLILLDAYPQEHLIRAEAQTTRAAKMLSLSAARVGREKLHRQKHDTFVGYLRQRLSGAISQADDGHDGVETASKQQRRLDRVADANYDAYYAYEAKPYTGDLALIRPERRIGHVDLDPTLGWSAFAQNVDVRFLCKFRFDMFVEPGLSQFANVMYQLLPRDA